MILHSDIIGQAQLQAHYQNIKPINSPLLFQKIYDNLENLHHIIKETSQNQNQIYLQLQA